ncbi:MAG: bile acid:sodium symporter [Candidatus Moraniibacteriota bacterium]|nr:MAG: bile acid:sodium symporter [Candidatus Moranbacteria bacterium]
MTSMPTGVHRRLDDLPFLGLAAALCCGLAFPTWFSPYFGWTGILLQFIFFTSGLRIDARAIFSELRDMKLFAAVSLFRLVVFPLFVYLLAVVFFPHLMMPLVLLAAMPAGMTSPLFVDMVRGNVPLALFLTAGTSLLSVITLPIILGLLGGESTVFDPWMIFRTLLFIMAVPIALAQAVRAFPFGRDLIVKGQSLSRFSSILALWLLIGTIASKNSAAIRSGFVGSDALTAFLIMSGLLVLFHLACYAIGFWRSRRDRITVTLSLSYMNFTLAIFLAETLFRDPAAMLVVILSMLPWNIGLIVFQWLVRRKGWMISSDTERKEKPAFAG